MDVQAGVDAVRALLQPDGADCDVVAVDGDTGLLRLRLRLEEAGCEECVLPRELLETIALDVVQRHHPAVRQVTIDDPRI